MRPSPPVPNCGAGWRCSGIIINQATGEKCCLGSRRTERVGSFFYNRNLPVNVVLAILYEWLSHAKRDKIAKRLGVSKKAVRRVLNAFYQMIQEDLSLEDDLRIGNKTFILYVT